MEKFMSMALTGTMMVLVSLILVVALAARMFYSFGWLAFVADQTKLQKRYIACRFIVFVTSVAVMVTLVMAYTRSSWWWLIAATAMKVAQTAAETAVSIMQTQGWEALDKQKEVKN